MGLAWRNCTDAYVGHRASIGGPLKPRWQGGLHHVPKAKRVVQLFMNGGAVTSTHSTTNGAGQATWRESRLRYQVGATSEPGAIMQSPFEFKRHGGAVVGEQRFFRNGRVRRRVGLPDGMASKTNVPWAGQLYAKHRFPHAGLSIPWRMVSYGLGNLTTICRHLSCARSAGAAVQRNR